MSKRHPIINNTLINIINTIFSFLMALIMTPIIINRMGIENYGIWVFLSIFSISGFISLLDFGFQGAAVKYIAEFFSKKEFSKLQSIISINVLFFSLVGIVSAVSLYIFNIFFLNKVFQLPPDSHQIISTLVNIIAISMIYQFPTLAYSSVITGLQRFGYLRVISTISILLSNITIFIFLTKDNGLVFMVLVSLITSLTILLFYMWAVRRILPEIKFSFRSAKFKEFKLLFKMSSQLFISKIIGLIFNNTDKILIGIFLTVNYQTSYDIVNKIYLGLLAIFSVMNQAIVPVTSEFAAKNDIPGLQLLLVRATKYATALVLPAFIFLQIFPKELLYSWMGPQFASLSPLVQLFISHMIITVMVGIGSTMLVGVNKIMAGLKISVWAALLNLVISVATVKFLGITGLILGTVVAYFISSFLYIILFKKIFFISILNFLKKVLFSQLIPALIILIILLPIKLLFDISNIFILILIFLSTYLIYLPTFYFLSLEDDEKKLGIDLISSFKRQLSLIFTKS